MMIVKKKESVDYHGMTRIQWQWRKLSWHITVSLLELMTKIQDIAMTFFCTFVLFIFPYKKIGHRNKDCIQSIIPQCLYLLCIFLFLLTSDLTFFNFLIFFAIRFIRLEVKVNEQGHDPNTNAFPPSPLFLLVLFEDEQKGRNDEAANFHSCHCSSYCISVWDVDGGVKLCSRFVF